MLRACAIALTAFAVAAAPAWAEEAVIVRTSAPGLPAKTRVQVGAAVEIPQGAAVTVLFRDGRTAIFQGDGQAVRLDAPADAREDPADALAAMARKPDPRPAFGATRSPGAAAAFIASGGDLLAAYEQGCRITACRAVLEELDALGPRSLFLRPRAGFDSPDSFEVIADADARVRCWLADGAGGEIAPFGAPGRLVRAGIASRGTAPVGAKIGCAAVSPGADPPADFASAPVAATITLPTQ